ncbi:MAG: trypsin-like peptidase domain-containing protein [Oscillospiraceae bacterium]|nr:trypsin-like peptidase domain-containing protein [Oscillospiraceae bacterium]
MKPEQNGTTGWYAPLKAERRQSAPAPRAEKKKRKKRLSPGARFLLGTLLVVGLITASSLFFAERSGPQENPPAGEHTPFTQPFAPEGPGEYPDDWQAFFDSFFLPAETGSGTTNIPAVEKRPDWRLTLTPPEERELSLQEIYRAVSDSIVMIHAYMDGYSGYYFGSGIIASADGIIITNAHVLEDCDRVTVTLPDNTQYKALLVGTDWASDIAVLKIEAEGLPAAVFGDSDALAVGDHVAAIGNPLGEELRASMTDGIISATPRDMEFDGHSTSLLQTNAAINEGSSGGALVNMYGQVVGVTNMKMMSYEIPVEGLCFAVPSATLNTVVNALIQDGEVRGRPALGVTLGAITQEMAAQYDLPDGLYVSAVSEGADAHGKLLEGDIVTAVNGKPARSTEDILAERKNMQVGDPITFTVWRDGESIDVTFKAVEYNDIY